MCMRIYIYILYIYVIYIYIYIYCFKKTHTQTKKFPLANLFVRIYVFSLQTIKDRTDHLVKDFDDEIRRQYNKYKISRIRVKKHQQTHEYFYFLYYHHYILIIF